MAEHLVPAAGDRLVGRRRHPEQDVPDAVVPHLPGAGEVEAAGAVVEQRRVGRSQRERDERVRLVPGGADRVEAELLRLEPARGVVDRPAVDLRPPGGAGLAGAGAAPGSGASARSASTRCCSSGSRSSAIRR